MIWDTLTSPELSAMDRRCVVLLPLAATEQHGPHLPMATDRLLAEAIVRHAERRRPQRCLLLPCPPVGYSMHHRAFPGTLSVPHETLIAYAHGMLRCAMEDGFRRVVLLNAHGGNQALGGVLLEQLGADWPQAHIVFTSWWRLAQSRLMEITTTGPGGVGHACEFETSLMLHLHPRMVRSEQIAPGTNRPTFSWAQADMLRGSAASLHRSIDAMCPNGVFGDPTAASAEQGGRILDAVADALTGVIDDLYESDGPVTVTP